MIRTTFPSGVAGVVSTTRSMLGEGYAYSKVDLIHRNLSLGEVRSWSSGKDNKASLEDRVSFCCANKVEV